MKKSLNIRKDEPLHKWIDRLAEHFGWTADEREAVGDVSRESYIHGSRDAQEIWKKYNKQKY